MLTPVVARSPFFRSLAPLSTLPAQYIVHYEAGARKSKSVARGAAAAARGLAGMAYGLLPSFPFGAAPALPPSMPLPMPASSSAVVLAGSPGAVGWAGAGRRGGRRAPKGKRARISAAAAAPAPAASDDDEEEQFEEAIRQSMLLATAPAAAAAAAK